MNTMPRIPSALPRVAAALLFSLVASTTQAQALLPSAAHALDTMAPAGRFALRLEVRNNGYSTRFNNQGAEEDLASVFDGVNLNSGILPPLALLGPGATLGTTAMQSRVDTDYGELTLGYGITPDLTVGLIVPFAETRTRVNFSVAGGNVGFNPLFNPALPLGPGNFPFAPVMPGVPALNAAGVNRILTDPAFGYGYKALKSTSTSGLGDPTAGVLWRFHRGARDQAILGFGVRFGVAEGDDPDNLVDVPVGDASTDLRTRVEYFRDLGHQFDLRLLAESKVQTGDRVRRRVPAPGQVLAGAATKERLDRDLGDIWEFDAEIGRRFGDWRLSGTWHRYQKGSDRYDSSRGTDTSALEAGTYTVANQWRAALSWSGVGAWRAGALPLPLVFKLETQDTYGGRNFPKVRDVYLQVTTFF